jgi:hypothetical protein
MKLTRTGYRPFPCSTHFVESTCAAPSRYDPKLELAGAAAAVELRGCLPNVGVRMFSVGFSDNLSEVLHSPVDSSHRITWVDGCIHCSCRLWARDRLPPYPLRGCYSNV